MFSKGARTGWSGYGRRVCLLGRQLSFLRVDNSHDLHDVSVWQQLVEDDSVRDQYAGVVLGGGGLFFRDGESECF